MYKILTLPGDGIGPEVVQVAAQVLKHVAKTFHLVFETEEALIGGASIDQYGKPLVDEVIQKAKQADAVLLGAVGGPKWENLSHHLKPEAGLLGIREALGLYANLRPAMVYDSLVDASSLKKEIVSGTNILVVRELTGGIYFGKPKGIQKNEDGTERGFNTEVYSTPEIERIAQKAFQLARKRKRQVCSVDKSNVLESSVLWRQVVTQVAKRFPDVQLSHMYVDNCAMQLIRQPKQFDVIVTSNLFGDILSDEAAMLTGSIGMLPSASMGERLALYEPVHGSAPDIAGQDKANPLATILSCAMMLKYSFDLLDVSISVENAVKKVLEDGFRTQDLSHDGSCQMVGCREMGRLVCERIN
ncbi:MAG: 3-isopropylmalate dehydrogenase [Candidatus Omnitrophica bacterium CG11_big_fil_rev_8_21_14_0_20_45_26]|uniref:3-isopropylmalate dehydrogenase n=1 Tax=Candidatus Abzuiibacterium crystallinum TaxID=1974748 RepID=A0A2H0LQF9_9BACT|nr:MAG: 3-isopropylmalate dehydrogenase [Candidatus Omnitrophica bacterium CG11_big_fil_rev_8_21_14_0_20_45_26]PIW63438.1 MAG: 3-isopropylmalate dehydrogenase [Candidatus Omnitrophica bacterium CG12_big_fil_rev_8_21_14_0_65_45_16]